MSSTAPTLTRVYLMRHAEAAPAKPGERDFDRVLSEAGYAAAERVAERAVDLGYRPELVISSSAARCRQTADAVHRATSPLTEVQYLDTLYDAQAEVCLTLIEADEPAGTFMIVGHNPAVEQALEALVGRDAMQRLAPDGFPTGAIAVLDRQDSDGSWLLHDFLVS